MEDKTFAQAVEELNQRALTKITDEAIRCWAALQNGSRVSEVTTDIENPYMRDTIHHLLLYVLLQSLLFDAQHRGIIDRQRYEDLRNYVDSLTNCVKHSPFTTLPLTPTA